MILLLAWLAAASPEGLVRGADLAAFEALMGDGATPTTHALLHFLTDWPDSPLAERAWAAARERPDLDPAWTRRHRALIASLERSLAVHETNLQRSTEPGPVAPLALEPARSKVRPPWWVGPRVGVAVEGYGPGVTAGAHLGRGPIAGVARVQLDSALFGELALRLQPVSWRSAWVSVGADTAARGIVQVGFATPIRPWLAFEAGGGLRAGPSGAAAALRVELATSLSRRR